MGLGAIFKIALLYTLIGMGTVFCVLIFISICIWLLGKLFSPKKPAVQAAAAAAPPEEPEGIRPEIVAAIVAAIHEQLKNEEGVAEEGYIVRNVRRATWRHTS